MQTNNPFKVHSKLCSNTVSCCKFAAMEFITEPGNKIQEVSGFQAKQQDYGVQASRFHLGTFNVKIGAIKPELSSHKMSKKSAAKEKNNASKFLFATTNI